MIALSRTSVKTLTFSQPVSNLLFAIVSLNGNGYQFNRDFDVVSWGEGYCGCGEIARVEAGPSSGRTPVVGAPAPSSTSRTASFASRMRCRRSRGPPRPTGPGTD